jgi:hypothetical protein
MRTDAVIRQVNAEGRKRRYVPVVESGHPKSIWPGLSR